MQVEGIWDSTTVGASSVPLVSRVPQWKGVLVGLWRRPARSKPWTGEPTLNMRLKDPDSPGRRLAHHVVRVTPQVRKGVPRVHLWFQTGGMAGTATLAEDEARALAQALIDAIEESNSAAGPSASPV